MYDIRYYKKHQVGSYRSAKSILSYLLTILDISSMMDFGCGMGTWCQAAEELGIIDVIGIDKHAFDEEYMLLSDERYFENDLTKPTSFERKADLVVSVEVGEHIESSFSELFIGNLCRHGDIVLFSSALPFQGGTGHINERMCSYWTNIFNSYNYRIIDCIRPHFWDNQDVEVWYKNNCVLFVKNEIFHRVKKSIDIQSFPIDIIHPDMLKRIINNKKNNG